MRRLPLVTKLPPRAHFAEALFGSARYARLMKTSHIGGSVAPGWEPVRKAFENNFDATEEVGASVAVYHRGMKVVDLWGGSIESDDSSSTPYTDETLQLVFSTTKGIAAIAVGICVDRGWLSYDAPVSKYWPEFAAHDKFDATVAQALSHQCGIYTVDGPISLAEALDWETVTARVADTLPRWPIGTAHGYHAVTFGYIAGELVRRADPHGRSIGRFVQEEISQPLGVDFWIGLPEELEPLVAPLIAPDMPTDPAILAVIKMFVGPGTVLGDALSLNGALLGEVTASGISTLTFNTRAVHAAEIPAANGITNARSLAKIYAATLAPVDGVQLLSDSTRDAARATVTPEGEADKCMMIASTFGMGFMTHGTFTPYSGPGSYGHFGAGGSVAFAHPERDLAFGYAMNRMANSLIGDLRAQSMIDAAAACADALS